MWSTARHAHLQSHSGTLSLSCVITCFMSDNMFFFSCSGFIHYYLACTMGYCGSQSTRAESHLHLLLLPCDFKTYVTSLMWCYHTLCKRKRRLISWFVLENVSNLYTQALFFPKITEQDSQFPSFCHCITREHMRHSFLFQDWPAKPGKLLVTCPPV